MDYSLPGSSVHGILQARILEWVAIPSLGDLPNPGIEPKPSAFQVDSLPSPAIQETQVQSLCWENPLEKGMPTHSSILVWRIPWTEEPGGLVHGVTRVGHD